MNIRFNTLGYFLVLAILSFGCGYEKPDAIRLAEQAIPERIDYNFHVRPILSDKCFACHGPDAESQQGGLRLDTAEDAYKALESGEGHAIVPGKPGKSASYHRIISDDPGYVMPPPESHLRLTPVEIATLTRWIEQGAAYKPHWAFVVPQKTDLPEVKNASWPEQPLDYFTLAKLEQEHLAPSERASKETLIRRVTFDLTGLPPTLQEIDAFIEDASPDAYYNLVTRLLDSPAYGERMAADWLDVARYADSDGYLDDKHREFHPWRDWVIDAFNRNMPYDQFITWQLAGDLIPNATRESTLATAFNRLHKKNSEAGIEFEEYRVEYVADRTNTLGTGIMGLSMECARCHNHKYDPITQKEYYQLFGFFNSTFEIGTPVYGPGQVPGPALLLSTDEEDRKLDELNAEIARLEKNLLDISNANQAFEPWFARLNSTSEIERGIDGSLIAHYPFNRVTASPKEGTFLTANRIDPSRPASLVEPILKKGAQGNALFVSDYNKIQLGKDIGWYERTDAFSFQLYLLPDTVYEEAGVLWHAENLRLGLKGYSLHLKDNRLRFIIARSWPQNAIQVTTSHAIAPKRWSHITVTYDGSSKAEGVSIFVDGQRQEVDIDYDNLYKSILFVPDIHTYGFGGITLGARDKFNPIKHSGLDEIKVYNRQLSDLEVRATFSSHEARHVISNKATNRTLLKQHYIVAIDPATRKARQTLKAVHDQENDLISPIREIMVMGDLPEPRPTYVLDRGSYAAPSEQVIPITPEAILPFDDRYPRNRYGLAQWLFDEKNPLTARVYVNRIWQMHFGQGIVRTPDDFGSQGSLPSHPALLDWLALNFMESGWDIKALHKLIVTSATYMQNSRITPELLEHDPENVLLSRGPRYRLPAEMIRDNALSVSGLLISQQGGASVYPYQPEGLWDGLTTKGWAYKYLQEKGDGLYRRSIYTIWKRGAPPPFMQIFDVDDRGTCIVNRKLSSTPLQALNLLNDPQFVEASRVLAENLIKAEPDTAKRLEVAFRLLTGRKPDLTEQDMLAEFYQEELHHFTTHTASALAFMDNGEHEWDQDLNASEIAALGVVVSSLNEYSRSIYEKIISQYNEPIRKTRIDAPIPQGLPQKIGAGFGYTGVIQPPGQGRIRYCPGIR